MIKSLNILSIGNSFSQDAVTKLHDIALSGCVAINITNLYIGGCSLEMHWENIINDADAYAYELNGADTNKRISIKNALIEKPWDYVTLQQVSYLSINYTTYMPYIRNLSDYIKTYAPRGVSKDELMVLQRSAHSAVSTRSAKTK